MNVDKDEKQEDVLTILEYLDRRKGKQSIDQNEAECYDT